jgi:hypothetical protein
MQTFCIRFRFLFLIALPGLAGCTDPGSYVPLPGPGTTVDLRFKNPSSGNERVLKCEVAASDTERSVGLMFREELPPDHGMLFIYPRAAKLNFYMRNTSIPLSIAFLSDEGKILQIEDMRPHDERGVRSKMEVRYAVEANQGWFKQNGFAVEGGSQVVDIAKAVESIPVR